MSLICHHVAKVKSTSFVFAVLVVLSQPLAADDIQIGIYHSPPYNYVSDNRVVGKDVDLARNLTGILNTGAKFVGCPFLRCLELMKDGKLDLMMGLLKYPDRQRYIHFVAPPYMSTYSKYLVYGADARLHNIDQLEGKVVGYVRGSHIPDVFGKVQTYEFDDPLKLVQALDKQRVDYILGIESSIDPIITEQQLDAIKKTNLYVENKFDVFVGVSKKSSWRSRIKDISDALVQVANP